MNCFHALGKIQRVLHGCVYFFDVCFLVCRCCCLSLCVIGRRCLGEINSNACFHRSLKHGILVRTGIYSVLVVTYLSPLRPEEIQAYHDVELLVDVIVEDKNGIRDVFTFDSMLLPSHLQEDFLQQLFHWASAQGFIPWSCYGCWPGKIGTSSSETLLPLFYAWLQGASCQEGFLQ